ncbi:MAG: altronate hydrolase [Candidatus Pelagisphaera sp.]|jgi:altronate hydrolase
MSASILKVHPNDNIIVALCDLDPGQVLEYEGESITITEKVPAKHKFAAKPFGVNDILYMYGVKVGLANKSIAQGERIHVDNIIHAADGASISDATSSWQAPDTERWKNATFQGYHRANGSVGTANHWIVIPLVFCENRNLATMKEALLKPLGYGQESLYASYVTELVTAHNSGTDLDDVPELDASSNGTPRARMFPNVDGIKFLSHTLGCGGTAEDASTLAGLLAGYIAHPNVAGATVLSLGCQKVQIDHIKEEIERRDPNFSKPVHYFEQQKSASEKEMLSQAIRATFKGVAEANRCKREPAPISKLVLGVECGGSDGFSGISANPVIGSTSDKLVASGGSVILAEFPELCGVEQNLVDRSASPEIAERFLELMKAYASAAERVGSGFDHNPSPGNIKDGLTTDAIKSAGAALKGGTSPVRAVLDYPEWVIETGLNLLCTPGGDVESTTAMAGAGANMIVFSTGLGTPTGNPVTPVIKLSSNSKIARNLSDMIDFDTGSIIEGTASINDLADDLLDLIVRTASGENQTCAQVLGQDDFIPWKRGVSL